MKLKMLYSTKEDGNVSIKYDETEYEYLVNRRQFFIKNKIDYKNTVILKIKNSTEIAEIDKDFFIKNKKLTGVEILADCIITTVPNLFLYLPFADCVPLAIFDSKQNILAFAHLGWRSTELNLHLKIVNTLKNKYNSNVKDLEVIIGPSIKKESYILENPSQLKKDEWQPFLKFVQDNYYQIDLNGYIIDGLNKLGINKIINNEIDTAKDNRFFSHYRSTRIEPNEKEGRFICGAMMNDIDCL